MDRKGSNHRIEVEGSDTAKGQKEGANKRDKWIEEGVISV